MASLMKAGDIVPMYEQLLARDPSEDMAWAVLGPLCATARPERTA